MHCALQLHRVAVSSLSKLSVSSLLITSLVVANDPTLWCAGLWFAPIITKPCWGCSQKTGAKASFHKATPIEPDLMSEGTFVIHPCAMLSVHLHTRSFNGASSSGSPHGSSAMVPFSVSDYDHASHYSTVLMHLFPPNVPLSDRRWAEDFSKLLMLCTRVPHF